jgi:glycosyltransferase involved in cell wall biosynthesis
VPACNEIVTHEVNGLLAAAGDEAAFAGALERLLADPELGRGLGNNGRRTYEANYTIDVMVDRTIDLYRELLDLRAHCERHA